MSINLAQALLTATGTTTPRSLGARFSDVFNVKDFGAVGDGATNDAAAIQACFDAAFGSSGSPHGSAGALTNRPVFFPSGNYLIGTTLNLTRVVGGYIFGAAMQSVTLSYSGSVAGGGTITSVIKTNGCSKLRMKGLHIAISGTNTCAINLDWDNTAGGDGLHGNYFSDLLIEAATNGIIIANSGHQGHNNLFANTQFSSISGAGIDARGTAAIGNVSQMGGAAICGRAYLSSGGSIHVEGASLAGNTYDIEVGSGHPVTVVGGRTEGDFLKLTSGIVTVSGVTQFSVGTVEIVNITGGKAVFDGCASNEGVIAGNAGSLYLRGNSFIASGYAASVTTYNATSGTVAQNI